MKILSIMAHKVAPQSKKAVSKVRKPLAATLTEVQKPVIANIKSYYTSAEAKLNDILLDRIKNRQSTSAVEYNISQFESLPKCIKDCIKPSDISRTGHISQTKINDLWETAKKADKPGVYGRPPTFRGNEDEAIAEAVESGALAVDKESASDISELNLENLDPELLEILQTLNPDILDILSSKSLSDGDDSGVLAEILQSLGLQ